jgi:uncharacterized membrane protein YedE/YeeE
MRRLATWSGRRVLALWLVWFALLASIIALYLRSQWRSQSPVAIEQAPDLGPVAEQHTDVIVSVVGNATVLRLEAALLLLGPPGFLTVLWLYARHGRHRVPPGA